MRQGQIEIDGGIGQGDAVGAGGVVEVAVAAERLAEHDFADHARGRRVCRCDLPQGLQLLGQQGYEVAGYVWLRLQRAQDAVGRGGVAHHDEGLRVVELGAQVFGFEQQSALKGFEGCAMAALFQQPLAMLAIVGGAAQAVGLQAGKVGLGVGHCCVGRGRTGAVDGAICGLFRGVACGLRPGAKPNTPQQAGRQQRQA